MAGSNQHILLFGEVLFDCFPSGAVLGGAPLNVTWSLTGLGHQPKLISAVGDDQLGKDVLGALSDWGTPTKEIAVHPERPTGRVEVEVNNGEPSYTIVPEQAYDDAQLRNDFFEDYPKEEVYLLYHGTLALREAASRKTCEQLRTEYPERLFIDINLRSPWWDLDYVLSLLGGARWVKLNGDELSELSGHGTNGYGTEDELLSAAETFRNQHDIQNLFVTRGSDGAAALRNNKAPLVRKAPAPPKMVDTVGAGDAFSAVLIHGIVNEWPLELSLDRALLFASKVCTLQGATINDSGFYELSADAQTEVNSTA